MVLFSHLSAKAANLFYLPGKFLGKYLPGWLLLAGTLLVAWQLASFTWFLLGTNNHDHQQFMQLEEEKLVHQETPKQAKAYDLFETERKAVAKPSKPVRENLNLLLHGTIAQSNPKQGSALISPKNAVPQVYQVGEQVSPGVVLDEIYPSYVLLLRAGLHERLALPKSLLGADRSVQAPPKQTASRTAEPVVIKEPSVTRKLARYRRQLKENPMALARLVNGTPVMRDGQVQGVQISRGNDPTLIAEIGLQDKDIVMSLNGVSLGNVSQLPTIIKTLSEENRFEVVLERAGVAQSINIYLEM